MDERLLFGLRAITCAVPADICEKTVARLIADGTIPARRIGGRWAAYPSQIAEAFGRRDATVLARGEG